MNIILATDSYKFSHYLQYPPGTKHVSSYIEPRGISKGMPVTNEIVNVGLQGFIKKYLRSYVTEDNIKEAESLAKEHGVPFNREGWEYIVKKYNGMLPLKVEALPEGTIFPLGTAQVQIVNTDEKLPWLTSYLETSLLRSIWYPSTVATLSRECKKTIRKFVDQTSDHPADVIETMVSFMLHDFGARGVSSQESAEIGGMAHMLNFKGSDTFEALRYIRDVYRTPINKFVMPAFSVPAAEHSTITSWLSHGGESAAYANMVEQFGGDGKIYSVVSDSYDIHNAVEYIWGDELKEAVLKKGGRLVVRPDSGDPKTIILEILHLLSIKFGYTVNSKGYMVLHPSVRIIQGDGVDFEAISEILQEMKDYGYAAENLVFGMGGGLLQKVNRDSLKYAMKASAIFIGDKWYDVYKDPVTDSGKRSKRGRLVVTSDFRTVREDSNWTSNRLQTHWRIDELGTCEFHEDFHTIRARTAL